MSTTGPPDDDPAHKFWKDAESLRHRLTASGHCPIHMVKGCGCECMQLRAENLKLQDKLDDLMTGLEFWKQHKVAAAESTTMDEMLMRWIDYAKEI